MINEKIDNIGESILDQLDDLKESIQQNSCVVNGVVATGKERGQHDIDFDLAKQSGFILSEVLEALGFRNQDAMARNYINAFMAHGNPVNEEDIADAFADIIVFAINAIECLGYDANKVLGEVHKEVSGRVGTINTETGKWEKDTTVETYKANLLSCKREAEEIEAV